jgi:hypothetical protein
LAKASLLAFICLIRRGLWAAILDRILSFSTRSRLMCCNKTAATSGTLSLMLPAVAAGFFFMYLSNIFRACLEITEGHPEAFFLAGMERGGKDFAFTRSRLIDDQVFGDNRHWRPLLSPGHYSSFVLQRQLFDTFFCLLMQHFPKVTKTDFFVRPWVSSEKTARADCQIFTLSV